MADTAHTKPPAAAMARNQELLAQPKSTLERLDAALGQDLAPFNQAVVDAGIPPVIVVPFEKKR